MLEHGPNMAESLFVRGHCSTTGSESETVLYDDTSKADKHGGRSSRTQGKRVLMMSSLVQKRTSSDRSLDDHIHTLQKSVGDTEAQRFRSLEVDDQLVLGWLLNGNVLRPFALKNPMHKSRTVPNRRGTVSPKRHQASNIRKRAGR